jgi:hypothetical protein
MEPISGSKSLQEIAADRAIPLIQVVNFYEAGVAKLPIYFIVKLPLAHPA